MTDNQQLLEKYQNIIAEEVNVKEVALLPEHIQVTKTYVPLGNKLSSVFGKDTGQIIAAAKQGNIEELEAGNIKVIHQDQSWILNNTQYEIRYSGLAGDNQIVEDGAVVELDLALTPALQAEGVAREISRFLNQLRKDADYKVSDRVVCFRSSDSTPLQDVITTWNEFLQTEALLKSIEKGNETGDITREFEIDEGKIMFSLKR